MEWVLPPPKLVWSCTTGSPPWPASRRTAPTSIALQALGEVGAAEELDRVAVLVGAFAQVDLPQVGGELGLLVATAGHVLVRRHHLAPGLEAARDLRSRWPCRRSCASRCAPARRSAGAAAPSSSSRSRRPAARRRRSAAAPRSRGRGRRRRWRRAPGAPTCCDSRAAR